MTPLLPDDFVGKCVNHFTHACEKHPKFANKLPIVKDADIYEKILDICRGELARSITYGYCSVERIMDCEMTEVFEAYAKGDIPAAIEELYDAIAVLMRTICVLEGKQKLTKEVCE